MNEMIKKFEMSLTRYQLLSNDFIEKMKQVHCAKDLLGEQETK